MIDSVTINDAVKAYASSLSERLLREKPAKEEIGHVVDNQWSEQRRLAQLNISKLIPSEAYAIEAMRRAAEHNAHAFVTRYYHCMERRNWAQKILLMDNGAEKEKYAFEKLVVAEFLKVAAGLRPSY